MATKKTTSKTKKESRTMDIILLVLGIFMVTFVAVMIWLYKTTGGTPDTLIGCVCGMVGTECGIMGWIKNVKEKKQDRKWQKEDTKNRK